MSQILIYFDDLTNENAQGSTEVDAESGITSINIEDDPVVQELKMRYLLINELAKRIDLSKHSFML